MREMVFLSQVNVNMELCKGLEELNFKQTAKITVFGLWVASVL